MTIIKDQDGGIREYIGVNINKKNKKEIIGINETCLNDEMYYPLGAYKTEEETKQVMGLIENHIRDKYANETVMTLVPSRIERRENYELEATSYSLERKSRELAIFTMPNT